MSELNIADLRRRYTKGGLLEEKLPDKPIPLFKQWMDEAIHSEVMEPNAMALATVDEDNHPDVRTVLLKGIEDRAITFFTNYLSRKARELSKTPYASCVFWWPELERQIRLRGPVGKLSEEVSERYFKSRPRESQIGAWASHQSEVIENREELERKFNEIESRFAGKDVPKPDYWGGYSITPAEIEFWQGRPGRLHDRIRYRKEDQTWNRERLSP